MDIDDLRQRLLATSTAAICDANKGDVRELRVMDPGIRPIVAGLKFLGRAHTVSCFEDFLTVIKGLADAHCQAISTGRPSKLTFSP